MRAWTLLMVAALLEPGSAEATEVPPPPDPPKLQATAFSPDGRWLLAGYHRGEDRLPSLRLWDVKTGRQVKAFEGHHRRAEVVAFQPDGKRAVSIGLDYDPDKENDLRETVIVWDLEGGKELNRWDPKIQNFASYAGLSGDGKRLLCWKGRPREGGKLDLQVLSFEVATGKVLEARETKDYPTFRPDLSPDGKSAALAIHAPLGEPWETRVWDVEKGETVWSLRHPPDAWFKVMGWSPDARSLAVEKQDVDAKRGGKGKGYLVALDVVSRKETRLQRQWDNPRVEENGDVVRFVRFSPDGGRLLVAEGYQTIRCWNWATGKEIWAVEGYARDMAFAADGREVVLLHSAPPVEGARLSLQFLDAATGKLLREMKYDYAP